VRIEPGLSIAARKRQLVVDELTHTALRLFALRGFDATTLDEVVATAGVSKRTFFRYFTSKEDVVVQLLIGMGTDIGVELASRPTTERPSIALHHAIDVPFTACAEHPGAALQATQLILSTPALHARFLERQIQWRDDLAIELARRLSLDAQADLYPRLAASVALAAFNVVLQEWSDSDGAIDPTVLTKRAFTTIGPGLDRVE
jgi:AcrR family transcriptional regulator